MRNLHTICVAVLGCLIASPGAWAANATAAKNAQQQQQQLNLLWANKARPYATVLMPKTPLSFGEVANSGGMKIAAKLTPTVVSNHPYRLAISLSGLTLGGTALAIPANQLTVTVNGIPVPVGTTRVEIKTGPATSLQGVAVPITIEVTMKDAAACRAGRYGGNVTLFVK
jgi:hypothetical protein